MKKTAIAIFSACLIFSASSAVYASAPVTEKEIHMKKAEEKKKHEMHAKKVEEKKKHHLHMKKVEEKKHKLHAKSLHGKTIHSKSLKAKEITKMPKTGFGGSSEQTE